MPNSICTLAVTNSRQRAACNAATQQRKESAIKRLNPSLFLRLALKHTPLSKYYHPPKNGSNISPEPSSNKQCRLLKPSSAYFRFSAILNTMKLCKQHYRILQSNLLLPFTAHYEANQLS